MQFVYWGWDTVPQINENPNHISWAQEVYRALGWTFEEIEAAEAEHDALRSGEDASKTLSDELALAERQIVTETAVARVHEVISSDTSEQDLSALNADLAEEGEAGADARVGALIDRMITRARTDLNAERGHSQGLQGNNETKTALEQAAARTERLLEKAEAEGKLGRHEAAQTTLSEVEAALKDMRDIRLGLQAQQTPTGPSPDTARLIKAVDKGASALRGAGFSGPAAGLSATCDKLVAAQSPADDPAWRALLAEVKVADGSASKFRSIADHIETLCESLSNEGLTATADELRDELDDIRDGTSRTVMGSLGVLVQLEARAVHKDKFAKREEWTEAHLTERTDALRDALKTIFRTDADGNILTRKDETRVEKRAGEVPGLDHDVHVQIPRRADKKVPRATMEALLVSVTLLDELKGAGVKGVEDIAAEELLKAEELLDGLKNHTSEYDLMKKGLSKLSDKVAKLGSGNGKAYYIEARLHLAEDVAKLKSAYLTMNVSKAVRQMIDLETRAYNPLKFDVEHAAELRKSFDKLAAKANPLFDKIGAVMAELGQVDMLQQSLVASGLLDAEATRYAGALSLQRDEAVQLAENATTQEELTEAIRQIDTVLSNTERQLAELKGYRDHGGELSQAETAYFDQLAKEYKDGLQQVEKQQKDAAAFQDAMKPMVEELAAMLRAKEDPRRLVDMYRGYDRVDPETFDRSRLKDLVAELNQLKKESAANHSHAENMDRLNAVKDSLNGIRGEITGFREDVAKELRRFSANCTARLTQAAGFIRERCVDAVAAQQGDDQSVLDRAALQQFLNSVAAPLALDGLDQQVMVIGDKKAPLADRKAAREKALRLVRPLLTQLSENAAIRHYLNTPFSDFSRDLRTAQTELIQLELRLLQLAS